MTMNPGRAIASCAALLLLTITSVRAATSDVADAVMRGDSIAVRRLLTQKADVNAPQADGATALHWAVYQGDFATVDLLLNSGANVKVANGFGATPLSMAAENGDPAIVKRLLDAGADANERMGNSDTALMMAARTGNVATMQLLLDRGADVNAKEAARGTTALMWAVAQRHPAAVQLLVDRGANVSASSNPAWQERPVSYAKASDPRPSRKRGLFGNQIGPRNMRGTDGGGLTPLVFAARTNDLESVRILLAAGADVNQVTNYGWSPLLVAIQNRYLQLASFLLDRGANPNLANKGGWSPLYIAVDNRNIEGGDYPVRKADMDTLEFIKKLVDKGANVNWRVKDSTWFRTVFTSQWVHEEGATAFWRASQSSDLAVMKVLLEHGADPNIATTINVTPLQVAAGIGWVEGVTYEWSKEANIEAVKLLLSLGNDPNAQAETGRAALHGAGHKGRTGDHSVAGGCRREAGHQRLRHERQRRGWTTQRAHVVACRLRRWPYSDRHAVGDHSAGSRRAPAEVDDRARNAGAASGRTLESVCLAPELCDDVEPEALQDLK